MGGKLVPLGSLPGLEETIVTSLKFDSNNLLWTACYDGTVRAYNITSYDNFGFTLRKPVLLSEEGSSSMLIVWMGFGILPVASETN